MSPQAFRFQLAGDLSQDDVLNLNQARHTASSVFGGRPFVVDLTGIASIDGAGRELLDQWRRLGAELIVTAEKERARVQSIAGVPIDFVRTNRSQRKDNAMTSKLTLLLALGAAVATTLWAEDDGPKVDVTAAASISPPPAFAPMTRSERFSAYLKGLAGPETILRAAAAAGISQATNTPKEWGGGAEAYGYRIGNAFAQHMIRNTLQYGASAVLHEDNRYFASGQTGFFRRTKYAVASTFLARHDNGDRSLSFSHIGSAAGTAFISRAWQPRSTTTAGDGAVNFGIAMAADMGFNVFREFWPGMKRHFHRK